MRTLRFDDLTAHEQGKLVKGAIAPRPIAWITTQNHEGLINVAPFSYFSLVNERTLGVTIVSRNGQLKDTARNLEDTQEAVVHIASTDLLAKLDATGQAFPATVSEVKAVGLQVTPSETVNVAGLAEPKIRFETTLQQVIPLPLNQGEPSTLYLLKIEQAWIAEELFEPETGYLSFERLNPVSRLGGPWYGKTERIQDFTRQF